MVKKTHPIGRVLAAVFVLGSLATIFLDWVSEYLTYYDFLNEVINYIDYVGEDTEVLIFVIVSAILFLTAIIAIICACCGAKWGVFPYLFGALAAFAYFVYAVSEMGGDLGDMGIGAWLCPALALAAFLCMFIPDTAARPAYGGGYGGSYGEPARGMGYGRAADTWTCPNCGTILADRERFCPNCGGTRAAAPAVRHCASCGAVLAKGVGFCPNCGTPAGAARPAAPAAPTYTAPAAPTYTPPKAPTYAEPAAPAYAAPTAPVPPAPENPAPAVGFHAAGDDDL